MQYADWRDYRMLWLGEEIPQADFPRLARRASGYLDYFTRGRAAWDPACRALRMACCALAEIYRRREQALRAAEPAPAPRDGEGHALRQETVGDWSVSYALPGESAGAAAQAAGYAAGLEEELARTARQYLAGTGLLYRGGAR